MPTHLTPTPDVNAVIDDALYETYGQRDTARTQLITAKVLTALADAGLMVVAKEPLLAAKREAERQRKTGNHRFPSYASSSDEAWKRNPICGCGSSDCDILALIDLLIGPADPATIPGASDSLE